MPDAKFMKPWHGVPRERIEWWPTVHEDVCIGCGTCVTGCSRLVYRFDFDRKKAVVFDPMNCMVGCTTCANTCPTHAITFPDIDSVFAMESQPEVHHTIEDELISRRTDLEVSRDIPSPDRIIHMTIREIRDAGAHTRILTLAPRTPADALCQFSPGQFLEVWVPNQDWLSRAYSIGNAPREDGSVELQLRRREHGRFTAYAFEGARVGDVLTVRGPVGSFTFRSAPDTPLVFAAGGTAFAPIKAHIEQQLSLFPHRDVTLFWGVGRAEDFYELDVIEAWCQQNSNFRPVLALVGAPTAVSLPCALVVQGTLAEAIRSYPGELRGRDAYLAGPRGAIVTSVQALQARGVQHDHIFVDSFGI